MRMISAVGLVVASLAMMATSPREARGQGAVGFSPQVGLLPDGVALSATPAVSADRRYVRLSLGVGFQTIDGFSNFPVPAAVGGGGANRGGAGGAGGLGGLLGGGGGGAGAGGAGAGGAAGGNAGGGGIGVLSGMNGPLTTNTLTGSNPQAGYGPGYGSGYNDGSSSGFNGPTGYDPFLQDMARTRPSPPARKAKATRAKPAPARKAAAKAPAAQARKATADPAKGPRPTGG